MRRVTAGGIGVVVLSALLVLLVSCTTGRGHARAVPELNFAAMVNGKLEVNPPGFVPPRLIRETQVYPAYPDSLRAKGVTGAVVVEAEVTPSGEIGDVKVVKGLTDTPGAAEQAAEAAIRKWRFVAAKDPDGEPVQSWVRRTFTFSLATAGD